MTHIFCVESNDRRIEVKIFRQIITFVCHMIQCLSIVYKTSYKQSGLFVPNGGAPLMGGSPPVGGPQILTFSKSVIT